MLPTHKVPCPHCGGTLFTSLSLDDAIAPQTPTSPRIEADQEGYHMRCPRCRGRVPMESVGAEGRQAFRVARPRQELNDSRP
jgi:DNA-directed RNA polymerase subunit RPC12/RpoP